MMHQKKGIVQSTTGKHTFNKEQEVITHLKVATSLNITVVS